MRNVEKYIAKLDDEIYGTIVHEAAANELSIECEETLHILLENRKHAKCYLADLKAEYATSMASPAVHAPTAGTLRPAT